MGCKPPLPSLLILRTYEGFPAVIPFLCLVAYHFDRHLRDQPAEDDDRERARATRTSPVDKAEVSGRDEAKPTFRQTPDGLPVRSFAGLLATRGTLPLDGASPPGRLGNALRTALRPIVLPRTAFALLEIRPPGMLSDQ